MTYYHEPHTVQDIKEHIGWKEDLDVKEEVMALCDIVAQLEARLERAEQAAKMAIQNRMSS